ncbi:MAG: hypothetical protein N3A68_05345 [Bacteroidia bacterium]|nr:hypothetical protein [Bacteroidia bacterium]GIV23941.1 MAG: hypothetical protein KatS3mg025_1600 [Bacteroidia bacterium]
MVVLDPLRELFGFGLVGAWLGYTAYWLEWHRKPFWVYAVLVARIFAAWAFGWLYARYYCFGDTLKVYLTAGRLSYYLWHEPGVALALFFKEFSYNWEKVGWQVFFQDIELFGYDYEWSEPSNYIFYRLAVLPYVAAGGSYYGLQGLMGLIGGLLTYAAYRRWETVISLPRYFWVFLFLWPSVAFWFSGALRDTLVFPLMLYGAAWVASVRHWRDIGGGLALVAVLLLRPESMPLAIGVGLFLRFPSWWAISVGSVVGVLAFMYWVGPWAYRYRAEALAPVLHPELPEASVFYLDFKPTPWGVWKGLGGGIVYGLLGPLPWHIQKLLVAVYALEAWVGAGLMAYWGLWAWWRGGWKRSYVALLLLGVIVVGGVAMAVPYWGTLARQRVYGLCWMALGIAAAVQEGTQRAQNRLGQP